MSFDKYNVQKQSKMNEIINYLFFLRHTFEQLIYPLNWPHPIIYLLPVALEGLYDSPVPIIMGVNK